MRKYKFRAWNKNKKLMREVTSLVDIYHCSARAEVDKHTLEEWDFDDIELMQYTVLKDKNEKEIYEGDIIKDGLGEQLGKVIFKEGCFVIERLDGKGNTHYPETRMMHFEECEIIGNIYENPELL